MISLNDYIFFTEIFVKLKMILLIAILASYQGIIAQEARLMRYPDISDDGAIIFTYEEDLWLLKSGSADAQRLTRHPGNETQAKFSPDGKKIAFIAGYEGYSDLYVMLLVDLKPVRITYSNGGVHIMDWSNDGQFIYYTAFLRMSHELFRVPSKGGYSERIPVGKAWQAAVNGNQIVYNPSSADNMNWRGYRGGQQPDLFLADLSGKSFTKLTDWEGYDCSPLFMGNRLFFLSDRHYNRLNLFEMDIKTKKVEAVTGDSVWDIREPGSSSNALVFTSGGRLMKYNGKTAESVPVIIRSDRWMMRPYTVNPDAYVSEIFPGNENGTGYVESRGDIFK